MTNKSLKINIAHTEFSHQSNGLMICGYEWGESKADREDKANGVGSNVNLSAGCTFANKELCYGQKALDWPYDKRIIDWFGLWKHPLNKDHPGEFEKSIVQTNWCDTQAPAMDGNYTRLTTPAQVDNFIAHIEHFEPRLILFMGSKLIDALQSPNVLSRFEAIQGKRTQEPSLAQKPFPGRRFKVWFQTFERCEVVCLPHPSGSHGLSNSYISLFEGEMNELLSRYKRRKIDSLR